MNIMRILFIRHGYSCANYAGDRGLYHGWMRKYREDSMLTDAKIHTIRTCEFHE
jgi:hypothetical protein